MSPERLDTNISNISFITGLLICHSICVYFIPAKLTRLLFVTAMILLFYSIEGLSFSKSCSITTTVFSCTFCFASCFTRASARTLFATQSSYCLCNICDAVVAVDLALFDDISCSLKSVSRRDNACTVDSYLCTSRKR